MSVKIATKASQSSTIPVLLVVTFVERKKQETGITVIYEDVDSFGAGDSTGAVLLDLGGQKQTCGDSNVIHKIADIHPEVRGKHPQLVCTSFIWEQ